MSAQAASHNVLTINRMLLRAEGTGGQNQKLPLPSGALLAGDPGVLDMGAVDVDVPAVVPVQA